MCLLPGGSGGGGVTRDFAILVLAGIRVSFLLLLLLMMMLLVMVSLVLSNTSSR